MYNQFSVLILERLHGRKFAAILADRTEVSERTWRNRFSDGWDPSPQELEDFKAQTSASIVELMQSQGAWSREEAQEILGRLPSLRAGSGRPTADLIFLSSPCYGKDYPESIDVASQFDEYCHALLDAKKVGDIGETRRILLEVIEWVLSYCSKETSEADDLQALKEKLLSSKDLESLLEDAEPLGLSLIFLVLSCWDVEFCSNYTGGKARPYPLFSLVMPGLSRNVKLDEDSNFFLRNGAPAKRRIFEKSIAKLLDFMAVIIHWHKTSLPPEKIPSVKDTAAWFKEDVTRVTSWRDETTHFPDRQFNTVWRQAIQPDQDGNYAGPPTPMLVAAHLFSPLLIREGGKLRKWVVCFGDYERWWKFNLDRMRAKGLKFGSIPWPTCLTDQSVGSRSPDSWRSSQSSGRSSQPLDSQ